jgi:predicted Zn-dependent peptidase
MMFSIVALALAAQTAEVPQVPPAEAWRKAPPASAAPRTPVLPKFLTQKLDNGLTVMVAEVGTLPLVSFTLVTQGGSALDPKNQGGLTSLTYAMLEEGSGNLDSLAFSDAVADLGASFGSSSDRDRGDVSISGLSKNADAMLTLLSNAVRRPRFTPDDFERHKRQTVASLIQNRSSPQGLAFELFPALLYGAEHPFGHPPTGTPETVTALSLDDIKAQHDRVFGPNTSALIAAGAITLDQAVALAKKHFGDWAHPVAAVPLAPAVEPTKRTAVVVVDKPGSPQTIAVIGRPLFGRGHPDEVPMRLINEVYGGNFASRLNMNLREGKGYTYGANSQVAFRRGVGVFLAFAAVKSDVTGPALEQFFAEIDGLRSRRPEAPEIERARSGIIRSMPGTFETTGAIAGAAASLFIYELPLDYYETLAARYAEVGAETILKASDAYLTSDTMKVLLVGDAAQIVEPVKLLRLGEVELQKVE